VLEEQEKIKKKKNNNDNDNDDFIHISIVQIMLFTKHHYLLYFFLITSTNACNIWKASDCPQPPTADDEEIV
jgi:hypothetical protein